MKDRFPELSRINVLDDMTAALALTTKVSQYKQRLCTNRELLQFAAALTKARRVETQLLRQE